MYLSLMTKVTIFSYIMCIFIIIIFILFIYEYIRMKNKK